MPARVLKVQAAPGDRVAPGTPLVTLTAMKMELVCEAPLAGVVETVDCAVDQLVEADQLLVTVRGEPPALEHPEGTPG
jgi:biotin carboxyl carrier protein